jgi:hypothetical protein
LDIVNITNTNTDTSTINSTRATSSGNGIRKPDMTKRL